MVAFCSADPKVDINIPWLYREIIEAKTVAATWQISLVDDLQLPQLQYMLSLSVEDAKVAQAILLAFGMVSEVRRRRHLGTACS